MHVMVSFWEEDSLVYLLGRTDYPDCGDFKIPVRPGQSGFGLSFDELTRIEAFETDPVTGAVTQTTPRRPPPENPLPIPDFLRKQPVQS